MNRNAIFDALYALLQKAPGFVSSSRRLQMWSNVPTAEQPVWYLRERDDEYMERKSPNLPAIVKLQAEIWVYYKTDDPNEPPVIILDSLIDNLEAVLRPGPAFAVQTLGGLVQHCYIAGHIQRDDGAIGGQAIALIPLDILTTS